MYVSFSGGKDSTVLLHIAREVHPDIPAVFVDTGLEFPEIREFVKTWDDVEWLKPKMTFREVCKKYGYPVASKETSKKIYELRHYNVSEERKYRLLNGKGRFAIPKKHRRLLTAPFEVSHKCCDVMKKAPAKEYEKRTGRKVILGNMADESSLRTVVWMQYGCNAFATTRKTSSPMMFWTLQDVLGYLKIYEIPCCSVYGDIVQDQHGYRTTGEYRTGCMFCMFGTHLEETPNKFQRLRQAHPAAWEAAMRSVDEGGFGIGEVLDYMGIPKL